MKKRDLKPGDVFRFAGDSARYVNGRHVGVPPDKYRGLTTYAANIDHWHDVELLWSAAPPTTPPPAASPEVPHYKTLTPEPIDAIEGWGLNYNTGSAVAYIARAGKKVGVPEVDDIKKAITYLKREAARLEGRRAWE